MSAVGIIVAALALLVSIMLHEAGHFLTARRFGMKATRFFLGFGPTVWSTHRGETEYGVKALPAGGFVKIVGMTSLEEIPPGDEERAFYRQPAPQRAVVLSAGSAIHLILAFVLTYAALVYAGDFTSDRVTVGVDQVPACVVTDVNHRSCTDGAPVSPAHGVLRPGDRIVAVNGRPLHTETALRDTLRAGVPVHLVVERAGSRLPLTLTPVAAQQTVDGKTTTVARLGILLNTTPDPPTVGPLAAVPRSFSTMGKYLVGTGKGLARIPHTLATVLSGKQRNVNDVGTVVQATRISGQITSAQNVPLKVRIGDVILLIASLNFFIGVFNMLPLLPLDGGHVAILVFEQARSRIARMRGRRDPGRVDLNKVMPVTYAVFVALVGMSVILLYADIFQPINFNG
jgi:membrane-associated protease RseP (regulator of RpoE activity)